MRYRIEYHNRHCEYAESQKELEKRLTLKIILLRGKTDGKIRILQDQY